MKPEIKKKWLRALRSGKYKQGKEKLRTAKNEYCCLGVLCDIYSKEKKQKWRKLKDNTFLFLKNSDLLPLRVIKWAQLPDRNPDVRWRGEGSCLATLNDSGRSFETISNVIENQL